MPLRCRTAQRRKSCPSVMILLTPYSMVWDWQVSRADPMFFYWPMLLYPYYSLLLFSPFLFFLSTGLYCGAGVFGLIVCISFSLSLALPIYIIIWQTMTPMLHTSKPDRRRGTFDDLIYNSRKRENLQPEARQLCCDLNNNNHIEYINSINLQ